MDVERIQKINNLALDLVKQGLAVDREEAIAQAENIYKGQQSQEFSSMRETLQEVKSDQEAKIEPKSVDSHEDGLSQDKIKEILENNDLRNALSNNGLNLVREKYTWDIVAQKMEKVFLKIT